MATIWNASARRPGAGRRLRVLRQPVVQQARQIIEVRGLRRVNAQGIDLAAEDAGDIDVLVGCGAGHQPEFRHDPRFEPFPSEEFGVGERITRFGIDGAQCGLADGPVVGVQIGESLPVDLGAGDDRALRPDLADDTAQITPQSHARLDKAVRVSEEPDVLDAAELRRMDLFGTAQVRHRLPGEPVVVTAGVSVRDDAVRRAGAPGDPLHHGSADTELDVVRVCGDDQQALRRAAVGAVGPQLVHVFSLLPAPAGGKAHRVARPRHGTYAPP